MVAAAAAQVSALSDEELATALDASKVINTAPRYAKHRGRTSGEVIGFQNIELISDLSYGEWLDDLRQLKKQYPNKILIASIMEECRKEAWQQIAREVQETGVDGFELNLSCPHGMPERKMGMAVGENPDLVEQVCGWVKEVARIPVWAKMTPNVGNPTVPAGAALKGGADGRVVWAQRERPPQVVGGLAILFRGGERAADLADDRSHVLESHRPRGDSLRERDPVEVLEHEVGRAVRGQVEVMDRDDVRVPEPGRDLGLAAKPGEQLGVPLTGVQQLDRHALAGQTQVAGEEHRPHPTASEQRLDPVGVCDDGAHIEQRAGSRPGSRCMFHDLERIMTHGWLHEEG
jgi:hypothetical protein